MRATLGVVVSAAIAVVAPLAAARPGGGGDEVQCELRGPRLDRGAASAGSCLACHDGLVAASVSMRHPLDVRYAPAWLTRRDLRPMIPAAIVLADGRITCTSCHDGASPYRRKIAVPPGELCTSCHLR